MRRMTELPDLEEDRVGVFPVLCRKMSFNSAMQKASSGRFVCMVVFPLMMKSFLLSICLTWFGIGSNADKLSCADKHPANSNMYVISLYFFMNLILTFHLQKYVNKAGRDLWFL